MEWWQGFVGWLITVVLAGVAAGGAVAQIVWRRRDRPTVKFEVTPVGTWNSDELGTLRVFALANVGSGTASAVQLWVRRADLVTTEAAFAPPPVFRSGDHAKFAIQGDPAVAYVQVLWIEARDGISVRWLSLDIAGPLGDEEARQVAEYLRRRRWLPWRPARGPVGPVNGGVIRVTVKRGDEEHASAIARALTVD